MREERSNSSSGAIVAVVVIVLVLGLFGLLAVGGLAAMVFVRSSHASQAEARALMEAERAVMETRLAEVRSQEAAAKIESVRAELDAMKDLPLDPAAQPDLSPAVPGPELLLEIDAAGQFILAGKALSYEELKAALLAAHLDQGETLQVVIAAAPETPYKRVAQAIECAESARVTKVRFRNAAPKPDDTKTEDRTLDKKDADDRKADDAKAVEEFK